MYSDKYMLAETLTPISPHPHFSSLAIPDLDNMIGTYTDYEIYFHLIPSHPIPSHAYIPTYLPCLFDFDILSEKGERGRRELKKKKKNLATFFIEEKRRGEEEKRSRGEK